MAYTLRTGQVIAGLEPEDVRAAAVALGFYGGQLGPGDSLDQPDAMARALAAYLASVSRREAEERAHARRRDDPLRLADLADCVRRVQARKRTAADGVL